MADTILGRRPTTGTPAGRVGATGTAPNPLDRDYIGSQLDALYSTYGVSGGARGSGPLDREYYIDEIARSGGWMNGGPTSDNIGYWTNKIQADLAAHGYQPQAAAPPGTGAGSTPSPSAPTTPTAGTPNTWDPRHPWNAPGAPVTPRPGTPYYVPPIPPGLSPIPGHNPTTIPPATGPTAQPGSPNEVASRQRKKQTGPGRTQTILGGFGSGSPSTRAATLLGRY